MRDGERREGGEIRISPIEHQVACPLFFRDEVDKLFGTLRKRSSGPSCVVGHRNQWYPRIYVAAIPVWRKSHQTPLERLHGQSGRTFVLIDRR